MLRDTENYISSLDISDHGAEETFRRFLACLKVTTGTEEDLWSAKSREFPSTRLTWTITVRFCLFLNSNHVFSPSTIIRASCTEPTVTLPLSSRQPSQYILTTAIAKLVLPFSQSDFGITTLTLDKGPCFRMPHLHTDTEWGWHGY